MGTLWVVAVFKPFIALVDWVVPGPINAQSIGVHIAMLHTLFNSVNTLILLPFVKQYARLLERIIKEKPGEAEMKAVYLLPKTLMSTPELSLIHARKEIADMATISQTMFERVRGNFDHEAADFDAEIEWFTAKENYVDMMYEELSKFLIAITTTDLSEKTRNRVGMKLRIIAELEGMSDECLSLAFLLKKKRNKHLRFEAESLAALKPYADLVDEFLAFVAARLHVGMTEIELGMASEMEDKIDAFKKHLKKLARKRLKGGADVKAELLYIDLIRHVEKMGDCAYAIAEELRTFIS